MKKIESLQALRAIAFICIFLSHCDVLPTGPMGVSIFLILSGFLMFNSANKGNVPEVKHSFRFAAKKIAKLYPLHLLTLLAMIVVSVVAAEVKGGNGIIKAILNGMLLQAWVPNSEWYSTFNKVSWYLSVCLFVYFAFPYLYRKMQRLSLKQNAIEGGVLLTIQIVYSILLSTLLSEAIKFDYQKWITYICPLYRLIDFCYGMLMRKILYEWKRIQALKNNKTVVNIAEILLLVLWALQIYLYRRGYLIPNAFRFSTFWLPTSLLSVYVFAQKGELSQQY